jgi:hypothetical protein
MKIGRNLQYEVPDKCPNNCPFISPFEQGNTCSRCPIFVCSKFNYEGTEVSMLNPEDYDNKTAECWELLFKKIEEDKMKEPKWEKVKKGYDWCHVCYKKQDKSKIDASEIEKVDVKFPDGTIENHKVFRRTVRNYYTDHGNFHDATSVELHICVPYHDVEAEIDLSEVEIDVNNIQYEREN